MPRELGVLTEPVGHIIYPAWSPDGRRIVSGHSGSKLSDRNLVIWDGDTFKKLAVLGNYESTLWSLAWSPDGGRIGSGNHDGTVRVWDVRTLKVLRTLGGHKDIVRCVAWSPNMGCE